MGKRVGSGREQWHGRESGYVYHGCRCTKCTAANTEGVQSRANKPGKVAPPGTSDLNRYRYYGAKDDAARAANAERVAKQRASR